MSDILTNGRRLCLVSHNDFIRCFPDLIKPHTHRLSVRFLFSFVFTPVLTFFVEKIQTYKVAHIKGIDV